MVKPTIDLIGDRRTIVFSPTAAMARRVAEVFCEHRGDMARSLDGTSPDEHRKKVYKAHQSGEFQVLSVCGLCREEPAAWTVTRSRTGVPVAVRPRSIS